MNLKKTILTLACLGNISSAFSYGIDLKRCATWGDSLDGPQAAARWGWAKRCDPSIKQILQIAPHLLPDEQAKDQNGAVRTTYPVYGITASEGSYKNPKSYFAPKSANGDCNLPEDYHIVFLCLGGCFTPDQLVLTPEAYKDIKSMNDEKYPLVVSFFENEDGGLDTKTREVEYYTSSAIEGEHEIYIFKTASGHKVKVTEEHPLINDEGRVFQAADFKVGQSLMSPKGAEEIVSIEKEKYFGKVYNLSIKSNRVEEKVLLAQGVLSADVTYQNENSVRLGQMIFRLAGVPDEYVR